MGKTKIIIEMPTMLYHTLKLDGVWGYPRLTEIIRNGKPLPKGHGRLKDIDKVEQLLDLEQPDNVIAKALRNIIESVPTIIERSDNDGDTN